jgi:formylglycine-generating enzyme required for sulfatase activity
MIKKLFITLFILALFTGTAFTQSTPLSVVTAKATKDSGGNLSITWTTNNVAPVKAKIIFQLGIMPIAADPWVIETSLPAGTQHLVNVLVSEVPGSFEKIKISYLISENESTYREILKSEITSETPQSPISGTSQAIKLKQGFNFISFILNPDASLSSLAQNNSALIEDVYLFSAAAGSFLSLSESTLSTIAAGKGYIIKAKSEDTLTISGSAVPTIGNISLKSGFNLIGISQSVSVTTFSNLMKSSSIVKGLYKWSAAAGSFIQVVVDNAGIPALLDGVDPEFKAGESYFINTTSDTYLNYDGGLIKIGDGTSSVLNVAMPSFNPAGGTYTSAQSVTIACATSGATIKYTTDGSTPSSTNGMTYSSAITVNLSMALKAVALKTGMTDSDVATASYTINISSPQNLTIDLGGGVTLEMVKIPAGTFQMGCPSTEQDNWDNEQPVHTVTISTDYYMGKYELTQAQWMKINGSWPGSAPSSTYGVGNNNPAYYVSWDDICNTGGFLEKINAANPAGYSGFRLPTEAEWEYAARAETQTRFYWGDDPSYTLIGDYAWYFGNSGYKTHPVGEKQPNTFGLYDMSGNVWEWCSDWYGSYGSSAASDPAGPASGLYRVNRGGSWRHEGNYCRSAYRSYDAPSDRYNYLGFRLVLPTGQ